LHVLGIVALSEHHASLLKHVDHIQTKLPCRTYGSGPVNT
jgi:hypothetical protein